MNLKFLRKTSALVIILAIMGFFANPAPARADWTDIFGSFGGLFGGNNQNGNNQNNGSSNYDYNSTEAVHQGDLRVSKGARRIGPDQDYHDQITVRSGGLVEVLIQVENKNSNTNAPTIIRDELGGSVVYVKNSLKINGQAATSSQTGLTSGGILLAVPAKGKLTITYQFNVCGSSSYPIRASAYSAGIGSASDAIIISMENADSNYSNNYYNDDTSTCLTQFQPGSSSSTTGTSFNSSSDPFGSWTGVNNLTTTTSSDPFAGWSGVNNSTAIASTSNDPFGDWTGVDNANSATSTTSTSTNATNEPFGTWTGVNNSNVVSNPFGDWAPSTNNTTNSQSSDLFGTWTGVNNSQDISNPFGDWTGVQNGTENSGATSYDMSGYSSNRSIAYADTPDSTSSYTSYTAPTNYVAPTTGVNTWAPFGFAGLLTAAVVGFRKRKWLFN